MRYILLMLLAFASLANARTLTIGVDLSGSNPLLSHENFAYMASQYARTQILDLQDGDVVNLKLFGSRQDALNVLSQPITISRRNRARKVADQVARYLSAIPFRGVSQSSTNLVFWLESTSGFDCANNGSVLVITDGLESSSYVDGRDLLEGTKGLPDADVDLMGCSLFFYGLGAGWPPQSVKFVRGEWRRWSKQAGAIFDAYYL